MSQRTKEKDSTKKTPSSACAKHLESARLKEACEEWCFPLNVVKKRLQFHVTSLPRAKHCTSKKFPELKVSRSFLGEEETENIGSKFTRNGTDKKSFVWRLLTPDTKSRIMKAEAGNLASCCKQQNVAVRRYALYRGMMRQSRFQEDHEIKKDIKNRGEVSYNRHRKKEKDGISVVDTSKIQSDKYGASSSYLNASSFSNIPETTSLKSRNNDLMRSQIPTKRIYIREIISNGAIVDEIVDIKNERDWELLNCTAPLRHISSKSNEISCSLRFQDLRNFDVYYYPYPWR